MFNIVVDMVDNNLRARNVEDPGILPDLTYNFDDQQVQVWLNMNISIDLDEIDDIVWLTVTRHLKKGQS